MAIPLSHHPLFRSRDVDDAREQVARVFCDHRLDPLQCSASLHALQNRVTLRTSALNYLQYGAPVRITPGELETFFLVQIPLAGQAHIRCGAESHVASIREASVLSPLGDVDMQWDGNCQQVIVRFDKLALEQHLAELLGRSLRAPLRFQLRMRLDTEPARAWMRSVHFLLDEFEYSDTCSLHPVVLREFERMIMSGMLHSQPHNYSEALLRGTDVAPAAIRRAEAYIAEHVLEEISIDDLTAHTRVSARSLYENFKKFRGTSPLGYLRELRLTGARNDLLRANSSDSVTTIALRWKFNGLGRFAHMYRRRFGEFPSATLCKAAPAQLGRQFCQDQAL